MHNTNPRRIARMSACRGDLLENGIVLGAMDAAKLAAFVDEHLEYFQVMLGDDSSAEQILELARHERRVTGEVDHRLTACASDAEPDLAARLARAERRREAMADMTLEELVATATELRKRSAEVMEQIEAVQERFDAMHL